MNYYEMFKQLYIIPSLNYWVENHHFNQHSLVVTNDNTFTFIKCNSYYTNEFRLDEQIHFSNNHLKDSIRLK